MNLGELPAVCGKTCLYFQLERHVYLITEGSIVTSSITLQKYTAEAIIVFYFAKPNVALQRPFFGQFGV